MGLEMQPKMWYLAFVVLATTIRIVLRFLSKRRFCRLPPGPRGLPLLGNLLQIGSKPNESLQALAKQYGPILSLKLGTKTAIVISSPKVAKEFLKTNDHIFSGRIIPHADEAVSHYRSSLVFGQVGPYWKFLRRMSTEFLFKSRTLESLKNMRKEQIQRMNFRIFNEFATKGVEVNVDVGKIIFSATVNLMANMVFGSDILDHDSKELDDLKGAVRLVTIMLGTPNIADYFPILKPLDPQGVKRKAKRAFDTMYGTLDMLVKKRLNEGMDGHKDLVAALLQDNGLSMTNIKGYLADLFNAATDTSTTIIEWAMAELMKNPQVLAKVQEELDAVVGHDRRVEENDLEKLPYLVAFVKESLRLHPPVPLLLPHRADEEAEVCGYTIPKHAKILVNVWAIGRDPSVWCDPLKFDPERFMNSSIDYKGQHFELIPFGAGRRICVGLPLASKMIHYILASMLQSFDWRFPGVIEEMDMSDNFGVSLHKKIPLHVLARPRLLPELY